MRGNTGHGVRFPGSRPSSVHSGFETWDESFPLFASASNASFQQPRLACGPQHLLGHSCRLQFPFVPFLSAQVPFCPLQGLCAGCQLGQRFFPYTPQSVLLRHCMRNLTAKMPSTLGNNFHYLSSWHPLDVFPRLLAISITHFLPSLAVAKPGH